MSRNGLAALLVLSLLPSTLLAQESEAARLERAQSVLRRVPLIDGHNDLPWQFRERVGNRLREIDLRNDQTGLTPLLHTDIPRLRAGGVGAQFWSVYVPASLSEPDAVVATIEQIDVVHRMNASYPETFELALTAADIRRIHRGGKIASLIGIEGGYSIASSLGVLRQMYRLGARYMTLTHSSTIPWADSATGEPKHRGLTPFGHEVVREMNRLGMLLDLSHVSAETMDDALDTTRAPVIFSHSSARAIDGHPRNVPDDVLRRLPANGGVVMVTFVPSFVSETARQYGAERSAFAARLRSVHPGDPQRQRRELKEWEAANPVPRATLAQVADHIDHVRSIAGIDHIGIGSDYDGIGSTPDGLADASSFPALFAELLRRGYSERDLEKIAGLNVLRVMERAEAVAADVQRSTGPSEYSIKDLDSKHGPNIAKLRGAAGRIHVDDGGSGGVPVVFVHGNGSNLEVWRHQLDHLRKTRRAVAYDLRGMGKSEGAIDAGYSIPAMVGDLEAVIDGLGLDRVILVGHSYGGMIVSSYAGRHPHRVAGIVFADSAGDMTKADPAALADFRRMLEPETYERTVDSYFRQILKGARPEVEASVLASVKATPREVFVAASDGIRGLDGTAPLQRYPGPALAIVAEGFVDVPVAMHRSVEGMPFEVMTGVSHWLMMDQPTEFNAILDSFLERVDRDEE
ncbi:MAG TPA: alpha/beta fold hydrolase [Thermoanaerobaculia bacterium]|nr:alpha/beta fold hydrolase [Thermoanaerobaculia bacterium]